MAENVEVKLGADTAGLKKGVAEVKKEVGFMAEEAKRSGGKLREALGVAAVVGVAAIAIKRLASEIIMLSIGTEKVKELNDSFTFLKKNGKTFI